MRPMFDIAPDGYRVLHAHCGSSKDKRGGGIAITHRESVNVFTFNTEKYSEFESASVTCLVETPQLSW